MYNASHVHIKQWSALLCFGFRCKQWVDKCNDEDLKDKSPEQLYRYYRLCVKHFDPSSYESHATVSNMLHYT